MIEFSESELKILLASLSLLEEDVINDKIFVEGSARRLLEEQIKDIEVKLYQEMLKV